MSGPRTAVGLGSIGKKLLQLLLARIRTKSASQEGAVLCAQGKSKTVKLSRDAYATLCVLRRDLRVSQGRNSEERLPDFVGSLSELGQDAEDKIRDIGCGKVW